MLPRFLVSDSPPGAAPTRAHGPLAPTAPGAGALARAVSPPVVAHALAVPSPTRLVRGRVATLGGRFPLSLALKSGRLIVAPLFNRRSWVPRSRGRCLAP